MQGLPACGKTKKALDLVKGTEGIICDPHQWFEFTNLPFRHHRLTVARKWVWSRALTAAKQNWTPIVIDMHVGASSSLSKLARKSLNEMNYSIELVEPDSEDWKTIKLLLRDKDANRLELDKWAKILADRQSWFKYTAIRTSMHFWNLGE